MSSVSQATRGTVAARTVCYQNWIPPVLQNVKAFGTLPLIHFLCFLKSTVIPCKQSNLASFRTAISAYWFFPFLLALAQQRHAQETSTPVQHSTATMQRISSKGRVTAYTRLKCDLPTWLTLGGQSTITKSPVTSLKSEANLR